MMVKIRHKYDGREVSIDASLFWELATRRIRSRFVTLSTIEKSRTVGCSWY